MNPRTQESDPRRRADLAALELAREQGRKDAEIEIFQRETKEHFAAINGSIEKTAAGLAELRSDIQAIREHQGTRDLVNEALVNAKAEQDARKLSRGQMLALRVGAAGAYCGLIGLLVSNHHW